MSPRIASRVLGPVAVFTGWTVPLLWGCAHIPNYYKEDGPSATADWDSPTAADVKARYEPAPTRHRGWAQATVAAQDGGVPHWPLWLEDPFVDKGHGRTDETHPHDVYRLGWEDWVAFPYGPARWTANWLMLPVSAIVTPPWTVMESDGQLSRQFLGYDHDAAPVERTWLGAATVADGKAPSAQPGSSTQELTDAPPVAQPE